MKPAGFLTITFERLLWSRINLSTVQASFKFWGEAEPTAIYWDHNPSFQYGVASSYQNLLQYLKDMKVLVVEFRDLRTNCLVATGILNLMILLNGFSSVDLEQTVDIKQNKAKVGEFKVRIAYNEIKPQIPTFSYSVVESIKSSPSSHHPHRQPSFVSPSRDR